MVKCNSIRQLAVQHYNNGKTAKQIEAILDFKASLSTVYFWINEFKKSGKINHSKSTGRRVTVTTRCNKQKVKRLLKSKSGRSVSRHCKISQSSVVRICQELNLKVSFKDKFI